MNPKRCLHMRFQLAGVGTCPHGSWYTCPGPSAPVHPSSTAGLGGPSHTMDPSPAVSGQAVLDSHHTPCHHLGMALVFHPHIILLGGSSPFFWGLGIGSREHVLGNVGGCPCTHWHHVSGCLLQPLDSQDPCPGRRHLHLLPVSPRTWEVGLIPGSGRSPRRGNGNPLHPVFLPREFNGQKSLVDYSS